jgi:hypothetical protein
MSRLSLRLSAFVLLLAPIAALAGCRGDTWSQLAVGTTSREAALRAMGDDVRKTPDGLTVEEISGWPTAIEVTHVNITPGGAVAWKINYRGAVTHLMISQVVATEINYEGPLPQRLVRALRLPATLSDSEFVGELVQFVQDHVDIAAPETWTDIEKIRHDRYRSRFLGLMNVTMANLSGQGRLVRDEFSARVTGAPDAALRLEYASGGIYRLSITGSKSLGPFPIL